MNCSDAVALLYYKDEPLDLFPELFGLNQSHRVSGKTDVTLALNWTDFVHHNWLVSLLDAQVVEDVEDVGYWVGDSNAHCNDWSHDDACIPSSGKQLNGQNCRSYSTGFQQCKWKYTGCRYKKAMVCVGLECTPLGTPAPTTLRPTTSPTHIPTRSPSTSFPSISPTVSPSSRPTQSPIVCEFSQQGNKFVQTGANSPTGSGSTSTQGGFSIAISADGTVAAYGSPYDGFSNTIGAVYMLDYVGGTWVQQTKIIAPDPINTPLGARQGHSVSLSGDGTTLAFGGYNDNNAVGATWVYVRSNGTWTQQAKLIGTGGYSVASVQGRSGVGLSYDGNILISAGVADNGIGGFAGGVWVWTRTGTTWNQDTLIVETGIASFLPLQSAISGDGLTIAMGGEYEGSGVGGIWIYTYNLGAWSLQTTILANDSIGSAHQGSSVSLSFDGNVLGFGGSNDNSNVGAAWVYERTGGVTWTKISKLVPSASIGAAYFGFSIAVSPDGSTIAVGGYYDNSQLGATWLFARSTSSWLPRGGKIVGAGATGASQQGHSVDLSGDGVLVVGGPRDASSTGAMWTFECALVTFAPTRSPTLSPSKSPTTSKPSGSPTRSPSRSPTRTPVYVIYSAGKVNGGYGFAAAESLCISQATTLTPTPSFTTPCSGAKPFMAYNGVQTLAAKQVYTSTGAYVGMAGHLCDNLANHGDLNSICSGEHYWAFMDYYCNNAFGDPFYQPTCLNFTTSSSGQNGWTSSCASDLYFFIVEGSSSCDTLNHLLCRCEAL